MEDKLSDGRGLMSGEGGSDVPVLIVGAGPAGLTTAVALARHGVESLLVERRREGSRLPRATGVSTRTMELLRSWGLEEEIRAGEVEVEWVGWVCETLASASAGSGIPLGLPTREQSALISPTAPACVPQDHIEPVLARHLRSLGAARVELGTEVVGVDAGPDGVRAVLRDVAGGASRVVHARYLVAADGPRSTVRAALGIPMRGPDHIAERVSALFRAPLWALLGDRRYGLYPITHPEAAGVFVPAGRGDRWVYALEWDPEREHLSDYGEERMTRLIRLAAGVATLRPRIERIGAFSYAAQLADRFRRGSAFLAGDAAHRVSPRGGTGMNTAIHDGYDLGWKLAWVLRGWAEPDLLDSYEAERRPVAEHNVTRSADPNGSVREAGHELHADLGGRIAHVWLPSAAGRVSTLDGLGPGVTLFTGPECARWEAAAASVPGPLPLAVRGLDAVTARAMGIRGGGALLARPDGAPAGWLAGGGDSGDALRAAVAFARAGISGDTGVGTSGAAERKVA
jgi:2-polyprenyl-6-methoxyphenol hydroxylase-like FAD-dependent oxidoreductase